jgi:hypothetical protein
MGKLLRNTTEPTLTPGATKGVSEGSADVTGEWTMSTDEARERLDIDDGGLNGGSLLLCQPKRTLAPLTQLSPLFVDVGFRSVLVTLVPVTLGSVAFGRVRRVCPVLSGVVRRRCRRLRWGKRRRKELVRPRLAERGERQIYTRAEPPNDSKHERHKHNWTRWPARQPGNAHEQRRQADEESAKNL